MKTFLFTFITFCFIISFSSCQREVDGIIVNGTKDSTILQRLIIIDTHFVSGIDTVTTWNLFYDSNKRLSRLNASYYNNVSGPSRFDGAEEIQFFYSGADRTPMKIVDNYFDPTPPASNSSDTTFFSYNSSGMITKDSTGGPTNYEVRTFTQLANNRFKLHKKRRDFLSGGVYVDTTIIFLDWQNGNLLKEVDSLWIPSLSNWQVTEMNFNYDSKPNPFKPIALLYPTPASRDLPSFGIQALFFPTTNNFTREVFGSTIYTMKYEYGTNGLPKIAYDENDFKIIFKYTSL